MNKSFTVLFALALVAVAPLAHAQTQGPVLEKVIRLIRTNVPVALNKTTVKCSRADYAVPELKVLIPALAELTVMNHRNFQEGAPCVRAGECSAQLSPQLILAQGEGNIMAPTEIKLVQQLRPDVKNQVCRVTLVETVRVMIRGVAFDHTRHAEAGDRVLEDCR
ncbi:MAG TPA: hypothetical protein VFV50_02065 [Bdellovibrionales bacterium]|nr:hypothetical protein [Bdellovibrionales bacterium]